MTDKNSDHLQTLLTKFHATSLGEGDVNTGANVLSAMAVTLANLARTGSGIHTKEHSRMRVGTHLLISGGLSSSLVTDDVLANVAVCQNNLTAHLRRLFNDKRADAKNQGLKAMEFPGGAEANYSENALFQLEHKDSMTMEDPVEQWRTVLELPPNPRIDDLAAKPRIFVTAKSPKDLQSQLNGLHNNRPFVALELNTRSNVLDLSETCEALLGGLYPCDYSGETASGHLTVTDPSGVLSEVAADPNEKTLWLGRLVWLVDGELGPDASDAGVAEGKTPEGATGSRFAEALLSTLAKRLNNHDAGSTAHGFDLTQAQIHWVSFLGDMESCLPNITATARSLLASLAFGLIELAKAANCKRLNVSPDEVLALAKWIIQRMANARTTMCSTTDSEFRSHHARRILAKLNKRGLSSRDIYRHLNLPATLCEELLRVLQSSGLVLRDGKTWVLATDRLLLETEVRNLFIR